MAVKIITPTFAMPVAALAPTNTVTVTKSQRTFRQPLQSSTVPDTIPGLEFTLSAAGTEVPALFACLEGALFWSKPEASTNTPGRLTILVEGTLITPNLRRVRTLEAPAAKIIYENIDESTLKTRLVEMITAAYKTSTDHPDDESQWHLTMTKKRGLKQAKGKKSKKKSKNKVEKTDLKASLDSFKDDEAARQNAIKALVDKFVDSPSRTVQIQVAPGDKIADPAGPDRRVIFYTVDGSAQFINPLFYLYVYTHAGNRMDVITPLQNHPLIVAYPELASGPIPRPRVLVTVDGQPQDQFVLGELLQPHDHPKAKVKWLYNDAGKFKLDGPSGPFPDDPKAAGFWRDNGAEIARQAKELQVPCEVAGAIFIHESSGNATSYRIEPMVDSSRKEAAGLTDALREYDKAAGASMESLNVTPFVPVSTKFGEVVKTTLQLTFAAADAKSLTEDKYVGGKQRRLLIDDTFRPPIISHTETANRAFSALIPEERINRTIKQAAGTLYYDPSTNKNGVSNLADVKYKSPRPGRIRVLRAKRSQPFTSEVSVALFVNGASKATIPIKVDEDSKAAVDLAVDINKDDVIAIQIVSADALSAEVEFFLGVAAPAQGAPNVYLMVGAGTGTLADKMLPIPIPWVDTALVRQNRALTWKQITDLADVTQGRFMSAGIPQTLLSTALLNLNRIIDLDPGLLTRLGIDPPTTAASLIKGTTAQETPQKKGWLLEPVNGTFAGLAKIRLGYRDDATRFDLPDVSGNYNHNFVEELKKTKSEWGIVILKDSYVEGAAGSYNGLTELFDAGSVTPFPTVRLKR